MTLLQLSVVVPSVNTLRDVQDCLDRLDSQRADVELEVLLVERQGEMTRKAVRESHPWVRVLEVDQLTTIPQMRALAFEAAEGAAIAVIEDHVMVPDGWARAMLTALEDSDGVVAGSVDNAATETLMDWACFLCEYSHCLPPIGGGKVDWLTGNNVTYRKDLLGRFRDAYQAGKWENHLHEAFKAGGVDLVCHPEIVVGHKKHYSFGEYCSQRFLYSRSYTGARMQGQPFVKRFVFGAAAFLLPPVLFYRTIKSILSKGRYKGLLFKSLPLIALFVVAWGLGDVWGAWFGPGDSLAKVC